MPEALEISFFEFGRETSIWKKKKSISIDILLKPFKAPKRSLSFHFERVIWLVSLHIELQKTSNDKEREAYLIFSITVRQCWCPWKETTIFHKGGLSETYVTMDDRSIEFGAQRRRQGVTSWTVLTKTNEDVKSLRKIKCFSWVSDSFKKVDETCQLVRWRNNEDDRLLNNLCT